MTVSTPPNDWPNRPVPPLLDDDALALIRITSEFEKEPGIFFAAILDHEDKIVAHSDPELLNQPYAHLTE